MLKAIMDNVKSVAGTTLGVLTGSLATVALVPIYTFLIHVLQEASCNVYY